GVLHRWREAMVGDRGDPPFMRQPLTHHRVLGLVADAPGAAVDEENHRSWGRAFGHKQVQRLLRMRAVGHVEHLESPMVERPTRSGASRPLFWDPSRPGGADQITIYPNSPTARRLEEPDRGPARSERAPGPVRGPGPVLAQRRAPGPVLAQR